MNSDGGDDLILILGASENPKMQILFNNKKGYFYPKEEGRYSLRPGIEKVIPVDLDGDGDRDLFYFGNIINHQLKNTIKLWCGSIREMENLRI